MKKKILIFLLLVIFCLTTAQSVYADIIPPVIYEYEAFVNNLLGTKFFNYDKSNAHIIPYNTTLTVRSEFMEDGVLYGYVRYLDEYGTVKLSDLSIIDDVIEPKEDSKQNKTGRVYVFEGDEVYLYSGPSKKHKAVSSKIPVGTILEYDYDTDEWVYTQYNGVKGWLYVCSLESGPYGSSGIAMFSDELKVYRTVMTIKSGECLRARPDTGAAKVSKEIPANTMFTYEYYYSVDYNSKWMYCTYMGASGWLYQDSKGVNLADAIDPDESVVFISKEGGATLYKLATDTSSALSVKAPEAKVLTCSAMYRHTLNSKRDNWYYVNYNGTSAWLREVDVGTPYVQQFKIASGTAVIQAKPSFSSKIIDTLNTGDTVTSTFENSTYNADKEELWYRVKSGNVTGWIFHDTNLVPVGEISFTYDGLEPAADVKSDEVESVAVTEQTTLKEEQSIAEQTTLEEGQSVTDAVSEAETSAEVTEAAITETGPSSPVKTAVICISAAVVISLTAFVVILLIKKKKG